MYLSNIPFIQHVCTIGVVHPCICVHYWEFNHSMVNNCSNHHVTATVSGKPAGAITGLKSHRSMDRQGAGATLDQLISCEKE